MIASHRMRGQSRAGRQEALWLPNSVKRDIKYDIKRDCRLFHRMKAVFRSINGIEIEPNYGTGSAVNAIT